MDDPGSGTDACASLARGIAASVGRGPYRMTVGLRSLDPQDWIADGPDFDAQLREKRRLLDARGDVVAALPDTGPAQREVLAMLAAHLERRFPGRYAFGDGAVRVAATGERVPLDGPGEPIAAAGRLVPEDLCLMRPGADGFRLVAAALCFPTRWRLAEKLGRPMLAIHAPVPGYAEAIGAASDRVMTAVDAGRPLWRVNWSLVDSPELYQPERVPLARPLQAHDIGDRLWLRSERQTLTRLPGSGDVLFTIRIRQCTLSELCRLDGLAQRLLEQVRTMPAALRRYKRIDQVQGLLEDWLQARCGPAAPA